MPDLYLILHKVRGSPAFDIAERCEEMGSPSDPGPWWIIPTSGHRAHPYSSSRLSELTAEKMELLETSTYIPDSWPDHYSSRSAQKPLVQRVTSLLTHLGLGPKPIKRRPIE